MSNKARAVIIDNEKTAKEYIRSTGCDVTGMNLMASKAVYRTVKLIGVTAAAANIIKQELLAVGGDAAVHRGIMDATAAESDMLLMGTVKQYQRLIKKLRMYSFMLPEIAESISGVLVNMEGRPVRELRCRSKKITLGERTIVMGILNLTPDSFSDGGKFDNLDAAVEQAKRLVDEGADIVDVGAESTRPQAARVSAQEEISRIRPVLERLVGEIPVPISVDTYKSETARAALEMGAEIINDVWGCKKDAKMAQVMAQYPDVPVVLMHNQTGTEYQELMGDIIAGLAESVAIAEQAGVDASNIIIDPGIGFGKDTHQNLEVMRRLQEFQSLGKPVLLGTSRKSMIGKTLDLPVNERVEGTAATVTLGITMGVDIVRVHDVKEMARVVKMTDSMVRR